MAATLPTHDLTAADLKDLRDRYFRHIPKADLDARPESFVDGAVLSHYALALDRPQGTSKVRASIPDDATDGWSAGGHIVVEIVTKDRPFLVDSVMAFLTQSGFGVDRVIHPQLAVRRDITGALKAVESEGTQDADVTRESWMHLELDSSSDPDVFETIERGLQSVLRDVQEVVEDWTKMKEQALQIVDELKSSPPAVAQEKIDEASQLLSWLADDNFTFMGYREYELTGDPGEEQLKVIPATGLGILRADKAVSQMFSKLPPAARAKAREPNLLIVTKANSRATVHRPIYFDYIAVKTFDDAGAVTGERRFLGLFTSSAYTGSVTRIPILGNKVDTILKMLGYEPHSHNGKAVVDLMETYPRDELFQTSVDLLAPIADELLRMRERRQLRLFLRPDDYGRFLSCLVYLPRDRYTTDVRKRIERVLADEIGADPNIDYTVWVTESLIARVHLVVRPRKGRSIGDLDAQALEKRVADATRSWDDDFADAIAEALGEAATTETLAEFDHAFPEAYKEDFSAREAVADLGVVQRLRDGDPEDIALDFAPSPTGAHGEGQFKIFRTGEPLALTQVLPYFTALGVDVIDERPYHLECATRPAWIYDFGLRYRGDVDQQTLALFEDAFFACWRGLAEADGFNRLVLQGGLTWRQVVIVRAYAKYLRQAGTPFSQDYIESCLLDNIEIVRHLVQLFEARFDPAGGAPEDRTERIAQVEEPLEAALDEVASLDSDRILRSYRMLIRATLRTNYYQSDSDGHPKAYVSFKLEPRSIDELPEPRPRFEIFCYSPRVEGVHLRFGAVARGGLRWSDRREDFRTEVLGLVKAQMVKNAVIVPVGSKGGFFCKELPDPTTDREGWLAEGIACYKTFISSLLDVTDNRSGTETVPPRDVVRWDADDSYLVVAADKGTATFSDIANGVSIDYGFWLGDAFASGGSVGYDHKVMGITARGAWESVRRHFREMGVDCQKEDFTCVGVGDMSGDVFGNGMLLSEHIRLVAAFDHRHIFLDPNPDAATSYAERRRLFDLPRSSWEDYDASLISEGGGVFSRTRKSIAITPHVREALGLEEDVEAMTPPQLLTAILKAPVDLLWNGGIGTYVKSESETHDEVGDKANNAIRVNGSELRCRSVGEGGNLGLTQLGRIEYARHGGRLNTDFIDNSAGVDTSDHEVNIKILLDRIVERGDLTVEQRNELLPTMTDEVGGLVLEDNYEQNVSLAGSVHDAVSLLHSHAAWITRLERAGHLNREIEFLPSEKQVTERRAEGAGMTAPELSVLLAYTKIVLAEDLLESDIADDPYFRTHLFAYFPSALRQQYRAGMEEHPLRREIIVTKIVNEMVNAAGITFYPRLSGETGATAAELARAHAIATEIYDARALADEISALDNLVPSETQEQMRGALQTLTERASRWMVNNRRNVDVEASVEYFGTLVQHLVRSLPDLLVGREREAWLGRVAKLTDQGVPETMASRFAALGAAYAALAIADVSRTSDVDGMSAAAVHFEIGERLGLDQLVQRILALPRDDRWRTMARAALRDDLQAVHAELTSRVLASTDPSATAGDRVQAWSDTEGAVLARAGNTLEEVWTEDTPDLARLSVGLRVVRTLLT